MLQQKVKTSVVRISTICRIGNGLNVGLWSEETWNNAKQLEDHHHFGNGGVKGEDLKLIVQQVSSMIIMNRWAEGGTGSTTYGNSTNVRQKNMIWLWKFLHTWCILISYRHAWIFWFESPSVAVHAEYIIPSWMG